MLYKLIVKIISGSKKKKKIVFLCCKSVNVKKQKAFKNALMRTQVKRREIDANMFLAFNEYKLSNFGSWTE